MAPRLCCRKREYCVLAKLGRLTCLTVCGGPEHWQ
ncbi:hypothetical protein QTP86_027799 [Hemibagrus guttatus]|nr:hypothetical protein QTP86_027799 [Hemibagrus guttatus]